MDVLWFRLPRLAGDIQGFSGRIGQGHMLAILPREDHFQLGYVIVKGSYEALREEGIEKFHASLASLAPEFADRVSFIKRSSDVSILPVESSCLKRWHLPGSLFIGDAAHVMSPVGGVGINYAIQDAVVAANLLRGPLRAGRVTEQDLARVQSQRYLPTRFIRFQAFIQERVIRTALDPDASFTLPALFRLPWLRRLPGRIVGFGLRQVHVA